jgi:hypothetical protein
MPEKISDRMSENMSGQMSHRMPVGVGHSKEIFFSNVENPGRDHTAFGLFEVGGAVRMGALQEIDDHIRFTKSFGNCSFTVSCFENLVAEMA